MDEICQERIIKEAEKIVSILNNGNQNYIFGAGWMGRQFLNIAKLMHSSVEGFIVSNKEKETYLDLPVLTKGEVGNLENINIFVALRDQSEELKQELMTKCEVLCPIKYPYDITILEAKYYIDYFNKRGIDCSAENLELNGYCFKNPFNQSFDYMLSWVYEAGDLILPVLFGDYSRIDEGPYETENTLLEKGDVVLDCGANIGLFTSVALKKGCEVYAFEPMPTAITYLKALFENGNDKMKICPYAISDTVGTATFHVQNNDLLGASLLLNHNSIDQEYKVNVTTIDEYVANNKIEKVDYIKADIEGSERNMLNGAVNTIRKYSPKLSICTYHLPDDKEVLESIIKSINPQYVIEHRWKKLYAYVPST